MCDGNSVVPRYMFIRREIGMIRRISTTLGIVALGCAALMAVIDSRTLGQQLSGFETPAAETAGLDGEAARP